MDPLSDVLARVRPCDYRFRGLDAGGDWAIDFKRVFEGIKCYAVLTGACWIKIDSDADQVLLGAGDLVLVPGYKVVRLFSSSSARATDASIFFPQVPVGATAVLNGGGDCSGMGGFFEFEGPHVELLIRGLPPIIHLRAETTRTSLARSMERLMCELREPQPGSALIAAHLAQSLLVEALRLHLSAATPASTGWLFALADARVRAAITAMHADLPRRWTLADLACIAGMSRSSFACRFKELVGETVIEYLTRWRMILAADRLARDGATVADVSAAVGYDSESAFSAAFKRSFRCSPKQYRGSSVKFAADRYLPAGLAAS